MHNHSQRRGHVVVVGCGIAGAAAANRLHRQGFEVTTEHWTSSDEDIVRAALPQIERLLPGSTGNVATVHVQRWKHALVAGPLGRYRDLERFKSLTPPSSRVRFAGDAMSSSTIISCLCSGERAADEVVTALAG